MTQTPDNESGKVIQLFQLLAIKRQAELLIVDIKRNPTFTGHPDLLEEIWRTASSANDEELAQWREHVYSCPPCAAIISQIVSLYKNLNSSTLN